MAAACHIQVVYLEWFSYVRVDRRLFTICYQPKIWHSLSISLSIFSLSSSPLSLPQQDPLLQFRGPLRDVCAPSWQKYDRSFGLHKHLPCLALPPMSLCSLSLSLSLSPRLPQPQTIIGAQPLSPLELSVQVVDGVSLFYFSQVEFTPCF